MEMLLKRLEAEQQRVIRPSKINNVCSSVVPDAKWPDRPKPGQPARKWKVQASAPALHPPRLCQSEDYQTKKCRVPGLSLEKNYLLFVNRCRCPTRHCNSRPRAALPPGVGLIEKANSVVACSGVECVFHNEKVHLIENKRRVVCSIRSTRAIALMPYPDSKGGTGN